MHFHPCENNLCARACAGLLKEFIADKSFDCTQRISWAPDVSDDPRRQDFSFSLGGRAFFVVGMHPGAPRLARRTPMPCLVFNLHEQFEQPKASGKYSVLQEAIRTRDIALQDEILQRA